MSIFPKKALRGQAVTIHTGIKPLTGENRMLTPLIRVNVCDPRGNKTLILEKMIYLFSPDTPENTQSQNHSSLKATTPLLVLASYLEGKYSRQHLANMLNQFSETRHFYTTFSLPADAAAGKYLIQSEFILNGVRHPSSTLEEDFFLVEHLEVLDLKEEGCEKSAIIKNHSPEPADTCLISFDGSRIVRKRIVIPAENIVSLPVENHVSFLEYCEGQACLPLLTGDRKLCFHNPEWISLKKPGENNIWVMDSENNTAYELDEEYASLWEKASENAFTTTASEREPVCYQEMIKEGLLLEV